MRHPEGLEIFLTRMGDRFVEHPIPSEHQLPPPTSDPRFTEEFVGPCAAAFIYGCASFEWQVREKGLRFPDAQGSRPPSSTGQGAGSVRVETIVIDEDDPGVTSPLPPQRQANTATFDNARAQAAVYQRTQSSECAPMGVEAGLPQITLLQADKDGRKLPPVALIAKFTTATSPKARGVTLTTASSLHGKAVTATPTKADKTPSDLKHHFAAKEIKEAQSPGDTSLRSEASVDTNANVVLPEAPMNEPRKREATTQLDEEHDDLDDLEDELRKIQIRRKLRALKKQRSVAITSECHA